MQPFNRLRLHNRLGQPIDLNVCYVPYQGRDLIFVQSPEQNLHLIGKNAEPLAFQLRNYFGLETRRFEMIEIRPQALDEQLVRWRFGWIGHSPLAARRELVAEGQMRLLLNLVETADLAV